MISGIGTPISFEGIVGHLRLYGNWLRYQLIIWFRDTVGHTAARMRRRPSPPVSAHTPLKRNKESHQILPMIFIIYRYICGGTGTDSTVPTNTLQVPLLQVQ